MLLQALLQGPHRSGCPSQPPTSCCWLQWVELWCALPACYPVSPNLLTGLASHWAPYLTCPRAFLTQWLTGLWPLTAWLRSEGAPLSGTAQTHTITTPSTHTIYCC